MQDLYYQQYHLFRQHSLRLLRERFFSAGAGGAPGQVLMGLHNYQYYCRGSLLEVRWALKPYSKYQGSYSISVFLGIRFRGLGLRAFDSQESSALASILRDPTTEGSTKLLLLCCIPD